MSNKKIKPKYSGIAPRYSFIDFTFDQKADTLTFTCDCGKVDIIEWALQKIKEQPVGEPIYVCECGIKVIIGKPPIK